MRLVAPLAVAYVALAVLANWLASRYTITVPFTDYLAPAGVLCIGGVLVLRDWLQQLVGFSRALALMVAAGGASYLIGVGAGWTGLQRIAVASLVAFLASETVEAVIFAPLRTRSLSLGVALSATVGNALDSALFLWLAFGSEAFFAGNFVGKSELIAVGTALTLGRRAALPA